MKAPILTLRRLLLALLFCSGALSLPAATLKLNLEIQKQSASDLCVAGTNHDVNFRVTNNDSVSVDLSNLTVVMYFDSDISISVASCGSWASNLSTGLYSAVSCAVASGPTCTLGGKKANQSVTLSFGSLALGAGQVASFQAQVWRGGWAPFDVGCDNYSQPGTSTAWNNNSGYLLFQSGSLVCEYTNSSTQDPSSGVAPCSGASACGAAGSPTFTPTVTPTATPVPPTPTRSITVTFSASPSPAGTLTYTPTISPSPTHSPTRSASPSPSRTPSASPSPVPASPTITPTPLMSLVKSSNVSTAVLGGTLTYSLAWKNDSNGTVTYPITDVLGSALTFVGCDNSCGQSGQTITWSFSAPAGSSGTVKVWARVSSLP